jgi:hypothetical protein
MFSSTVRLWLELAEDTIPLASIGPHGVTVRSPVELPSGPAEVKMDLDGDCFAWLVFLPYGAVPFSTTIETHPRGPMRRVLPESR